MVAKQSAGNTFLNRLRAVLEEAFPPPDKIELRDEKGVIGLVTSAQFYGVDSLDRQTLVWKVLDRHLKPQERKKIVIIVTLTPKEKIAYTSKN
jgi:hypothetical protein